MVMETGPASLDQAARFLILLLVLVLKPLFDQPGHDRLGCLAAGLFKGGKKQLGRKTG